MRPRSSLRAIRSRDEALSRCFLCLVAIAVLASAPNPFAHKAAPQYPKDPRFSEFVFHSDEEPTVKDQTDSVNVRWPNMEASEAHLTIAYSSQTGFLPDQDPEFWLTAVATVPDETIQLLAEGETTDTLLPGIYPHLYEYVPPGMRVHHDRPGVRGQGPRAG